MAEHVPGEDHMDNGEQAVVCVNWALLMIEWHDLLNLSRN